VTITVIMQKIEALLVK